MPAPCLHKKDCVTCTFLLLKSNTFRSLQNHGYEKVTTVYLFARGREVCPELAIVFVAYLLRACVHSVFFSQHQHLFSTVSKEDRAQADPGERRYVDMGPNEDCFAYRLALIDKVVVGREQVCSLREAHRVMRFSFSSLKDLLLQCFPLKLSFGYT